MKLSEVGPFLQGKRIAGGRSQRLLAKATKLSHGTIGNLERGDFMTLDTLARVSRALGYKVALRMVKI